VNVDTQLGTIFTGLGDTVLLAWFAEATKYGHDPIKLYATGQRAELLRILGQDVLDKPWLLHSTEACFTKDVLGAGAIPRWMVVADVLNLSVIPAQPSHISISEEARAWAKKTADAAGRPFVLMYPQCNDHAREWPWVYWRELHWKLRMFQRYPLSVVAQRKDYMNGIPVVEKLPIEQLVALTNEADFVIGNDSFGVHLAGTLNRPTLTILGPTKPTAFSYMQLALAPFWTIAANEFPCTGCHAAWPFRTTCGSGCQSLYSLSADKVSTYALQLINQNATPTHTP